jgi:DNA topoisomerase-2
MFKKEDDSILEHHYSDDLKIEPKCYLPLLPMVLLNGSIGIGTGYACKILSYNPKDIRANIIAHLQGKRMRTLLPWYKNFTGGINKVDGTAFEIKGKLEIINTTTIKITELPVGTYLDKYKAHLIKMETNGLIKEFEDGSTESQFEFNIKVPRSTTSLPIDKLYSVFNLVTKVTENITVWDVEWNIKYYSTANKLIKDFTDYRLDKYEDRRLNMIKVHSDELKWLVEKLKFIKYYLDNSQAFTRRGKDSLFKMLTKEGFVHCDRLLNLRIYTLTKDEIIKLKDQIRGVNQKIKDLNKMTAKDMYIDELKGLKL